MPPGFTAWANTFNALTNKFFAAMNAEIYHVAVLFIALVPARAWPSTAHVLFSACNSQGQRWQINIFFHKASSRLKGLKGLKPLNS